MPRKPRPSYSLQSLPYKGGGTTAECVIRAVHPVWDEGFRSKIEKVLLSPTSEEMLNLDLNDQGPSPISLELSTLLVRALTLDRYIEGHRTGHWVCREGKKETEVREVIARPLGVFPSRRYVLLFCSGW